MKLELKKVYFKYFWWIWQTFLIVLSAFFLVMGIMICIYSYQLNNPFHFILSFFASNLIILISAVIFAGLIYRMVGVYKLINKKEMSQEDMNTSSNSLDKKNK